MWLPENLKLHVALAGVAQFGHRPAHRKVAGWIPSCGTFLGWGLDSWLQVA